MKNVFVTGISGYIGMRVAAALLGERGVRLIVGCDLRKPGISDPKVVFYLRDVRMPLGYILERHRIDTVVHAAFVLPPIHDVRLMEEINVMGTENVIRASMGAGVKHLLYTSSSTAYGFHRDNDRPLTEESPLRGNDDFTYSRTKRQVEMMIDGIAKGDGGMKITVLRPCFVVGPGFRNPLAQYLQKRIVILPRRTEDLQFVHENDLLDIIMIVLRKRIAGTFNVGAAGTVPFNEMVRLLGGMLLHMPLGLLWRLNGIAWKLRLVSMTLFPSPALNMTVHPWVVSSEKLARATGFRYRYSSREAFENFVAFVRENR
ncbi:MAG: NAD-dependent epimerase/dehydratase family protein [Spirochaetes bacterium]|nr:NAD-dependent epimerase/dehydratase family protein [Spirochaetota bacterium]